jgi:hypothetical protein
MHEDDPGDRARHRTSILSRLRKLVALIRGRGRPGPIGRCEQCGVTFAGAPERRSQIEQVLRVHRSICPGGSRDHEVVTPFD